MFYTNDEVIKQLACMHMQRCEPQYIYKRPCYYILPFFLLNSFLFKVELVSLSICCRLSVFPNNSVRRRPAMLKIDMLYYFLRNWFLDISRWAFNI